MSTPRDLSEEGDAEELLRKDISQLRSVKKEVFEWLRPVSDVLERVAQHERECMDIEQRLIAERHDREKQKQTVERLIEVESELKHVKSEKDKLMRSLGEGANYSKAQKLRIAELETRATVAERELSLAAATVQARPKDDARITELQKQLHETRDLQNRTTEELSETRQRLSKVQERLTVAEQVTAATQQRELQESGNSDELNWN